MRRARTFFACGLCLWGQSFWLQARPGSAIRTDAYVPKAAVMRAWRAAGRMLAPGREPGLHLLPARSEPLVQGTLLKKALGSPLPMLVRLRQALRAAPMQAEPQVWHPLAPGWRQRQELASGLERAE